MSTRTVRRLLLLCAVACGISLIYLRWFAPPELPPWLSFNDLKDSKINWANIPALYPPDAIRPLPTSYAKTPRIQYDFQAEPEEQKVQRLQRRDAVKAAFGRSWLAYRKHAWLKDEVMPISGGSRNTFGGWGATLVDSLDTLWIMDMEQDFAIAVMALKNIDFTRPQIENLNVFETTIRYLGGLLAAHDLSKGKYPTLLEKAVELGDMLYAAFDTPNRMPVTRWDWVSYAAEIPQQASANTISSEIGSLSLEFTRLSQLTGDPKWFDAVERITDVLVLSQGRTKIPGLWPIALNAKKQYFTDDRQFSFGGMADSLYEYLLKQHLLLSTTSQRYSGMYAAAVETAKKHLFFRPMVPESLDILISGNVRVIGTSDIRLEPQGQHLTCFVGGMLAMGSRSLSRPDDLVTARQITDGCVWAYDSMPSGIMPELFRTVPCNATSACPWDEQRWYGAVAERYKSANSDDGPSFVESMRLPTGWVEVSDGRYILRPEAIESVFVMYRVTGEKQWQDKAWRMFQAIEKATRTQLAYTALGNVNDEIPKQMDSCESFWTAETLKYFYLIFSEPELISLDDYVLNTEAHPLERRKSS